MVNVVLLFAINRRDRILFHEMTIWCASFGIWKSLEKVLGGNSYEEFIERY